MVQAQTLYVDLPWGSENEGVADDTCYLPLKYHKITSLETGVHNTEPVTSLCSCHGVFTNQFIFRTILAQTESVKATDLKMVFFLGFENDVEFLSYLILRMRCGRGESLSFPGITALK